ncbi:hypothetical protein BH09GEM1_BH09GEM1_44770 [soil metagenome]
MSDTSGGHLAMTAQRRLRGALAVVACAALSMSACDVHGVSAPGGLASLSVTPNPQVLAVGATQQFTAVGSDFAGVPIAATTTFSIVAGGGTITPSGMFTAGVGVGTFASTIKATSGNISAVATVTIVAGPLATIVVTPNPTTLQVGATQQYTAVGKDASGNVVAFTPTWSVIAGGGAISGAGLFTAGTLAGTYTNTVQASALGIIGTATVTVTAGPLASIVVTPNPMTLAAGATQAYTAAGKDASGNAVAITPVWSVAAGGGLISAAGVFTAGTTPGTFTNTVKATSGSVSGTATVTVTAGALATITVTPNPATLGTGATQAFTAVGMDGSGNIVAITPTWAVVAGGGSIDIATGVFTAGSVSGTFTNTVRASVGAVAGFATVTVTPGPLATIIVSPNPATVPANGTQTFTAVGNDASGNVVAITPAWSVTSGGGTIVSGTGVFTAGATPGTFTNTVRATSGAISGTATVIVTAGTLATITVTPNPASVPVGGTQAFTAVGKDGLGNVVPITPTWSVVAGGGTIGLSTGVFTAGTASGTYPNTVRASVGAIAGFATVTVTPGPLASITVLPNPATVQTTAQQQFTALGRDSNGNPVPVTPVWAVVNGGGTIDPATGVFTAGAVTGTFTGTVQATSGLTSGTATVIVTATPAPAPFIPLGAAAPNGIMAGTAVTCVSLGIINADVSISPGSTITGYPPCVITGVQHLADAQAAQAQIDLTTAYNQLAGLPCPPANAIVANLGGTTKAAGVYCTASGIGVTGVLTLDGGGDPNATFVFQAGTGLTTAGDIVLINGAQAKNVYWQVGTSATIGTASKWQGNIVALTSITLVDNATLIGRALARNGAVTLGTNNVITLP